MRDLKVDTTYDAENSRMFAEDRLQPQRILDAQRAVWADLRVIGAKQKTLAKNFLILGRPFEHNGKFYSRILNDEIRGKTPGYEPPSVEKLNSSDQSWQVVQNPAPGVPVAWEHAGDGEAQVLSWHTGMGAEAKDGRVLFNLHYKDGWTALFHEPVHESAPDGGIGTSPRWIYEGYCEIFAAKIAAKLGYPYSLDGVYAEYARETQKIIAFVSDTYFARAYFLNDDWSYGLIAPLFYEPVVGKAIAPPIDPKYCPLPTFRNDVPPIIRQIITSIVSSPRKPEWYKRWVRLYGRSDTMPDVPAALGAPTAMGMPGSGPPPPPVMGMKGSAPPPPPMAMGKTGSAPPPPPMLNKGPGGPPPPPPLGMKGPGGPPPPPGVPGTGAPAAAVARLTGKIPPADWPADA